jgi:hypothetical protein
MFYTRTYRSITYTAAVLCLALAGCDLFGANSGSTRPPVDDTGVPAELRAAYREDAARLALRHLAEQGDLDEQSVTLPAGLVDELYGALIRVYHATDLPGRDSVVTPQPIHTFGNPVLHSLIVSVDQTAADWPRAWRDGEALTGEPSVDALVEDYGLRVESYYDWPSGHAAVLHTDDPLNLKALAARFEGIPGVRYAEPNGLAGDGNDIDALRGDTYWQLDYSIGSGDCPAGCIQRYTWRFRVYDDGRVTYLEH